VDEDAAKTNSFTTTHAGIPDRHKRFPTIAEGSSRSGRNIHVSSNNTAQRQLPTPPASVSPRDRWLSMGDTATSSLRDPTYSDNGLSFVFGMPGARSIAEVRSPLSSQVIGLDTPDPSYGSTSESSSHSLNVSNGIFTFLTSVNYMDTDISMDEFNQYGF